MNFSKLLRNVSGISQAHSSKLCWPAIGVGVASALALYLGFELYESGLMQGAHAEQARHAPLAGGHRFALMLVANIAAVLGAGASCLIAKRRTAGKRLAWHGYAVWIVATVLFLAQIALTTGPLPAARAEARAAPSPSFALLDDSR